MHNKSTVSVVIPVYNAEKYLEHCIESVLSQTFSLFELILINDGSNDNSGVICDKYATIDSRVRVYHTNNFGVSSARNLGIEKASGEWITFIDADDVIEQNFLDSFCLTCGTDISLQVGSHKVIANGSVIKEVVNPITGIVNINQAFEALESNLVLYTPWGKLYRLKVIREFGLTFDIRFKMGEDHLFCVNFLRHCPYVILHSDTVYKYTHDAPNSLSKRIPPTEETLTYMFIMRDSYHNLFSAYGFMSKKSYIARNNNFALELLRLIKGIIHENLKIQDQIYLRMILSKYKENFGVSIGLKFLIFIFFLKLNVNKIPVYKFLLKQKNIQF